MVLEGRRSQTLRVRPKGRWIARKGRGKERDPSGSGLDRRFGTFLCHKKEGGQQKLEILQANTLPPIPQGWKSYHQVRGKMSRFEGIGAVITFKKTLEGVSRSKRRRRGNLWGVLGSPGASHVGCTWEMTNTKTFRSLNQGEVSPTPGLV